MNELFGHSDKGSIDKLWKGKSKGLKNDTYNNQVETNMDVVIMMAGLFLTVGIIAFAALGVGVANQKHDVYMDAKEEY